MSYCDEDSSVAGPDNLVGRIFEHGCRVQSRAVSVVSGFPSAQHFVVGFNLSVIVGQMVGIDVVSIVLGADNSPWARSGV